VRLRGSTSRWSWTASFPHLADANSPSLRALVVAPKQLPRPFITPARRSSVASATVVDGNVPPPQIGSAMKAFDASHSSTSSSRRSRSSACASRRAAGALRTWRALSTSAVRAGIRAWRAACPARASAASASSVRRRRIASPASAISASATTHRAHEIAELRHRDAAQPEPARRRAGRPASARREDHRRREHAPRR
jgi:hypothetical protein